MAGRPVVGITIGDPAGIGPEIVVRAAADERVRTAAGVRLVGDRGGFGRGGARPPAREKGEARGGAAAPPGGPPGGGGARRGRPAPLTWFGGGRPGPGGA